MGAVRAALRKDPAAIHLETEGIKAVGAALAEMARKEADVIAVNGGDGTVQAVLTALFNERPFERPPPLVVLAGGMTNLIAHDVGTPGRPTAALERLFAGRAVGARRLRRPVMALTVAPEQPPIYGMFLGAAAFYRAVQLSRARVHRLGVERGLAFGLSLGYGLLAALLGHSGPNGFYRGERLELELDGVREPVTSCFLLLATTLERLMFGVMPFWDDGEGGLRCTVLPFPVPRFAAGLLPLLRGRPRPWMRASGYRSGRARQMRIATEGPLVLDGEIIETVPGRPVSIRADCEAEFLQI
jgi:hypothetical protein